MLEELKKLPGDYESPHGERAGAGYYQGNT